MTPITDKQRIDFVQRNNLIVERVANLIHKWFVLKIKRTPSGVIEKQFVCRGRTWRQAVDKAIRAYNGGKK